MLEQLLPANVFAVLLIFARVGSAMMLLPGFGEVYVPQRYRLLLALSIAMLLTPVLGADAAGAAGERGAARLADRRRGDGRRLPSAPSRASCSRRSTIAGTLVSLQLGLSAAQIFNPMAAQQSALTSAFFGVLGVLLIFLTDLHHLLLRAVVDSYDVFTPGVLPPLGDLSEVMVRGAANAFQLGVEMAAPFIVLGTVFFVALGVIGAAGAAAPGALRRPAAADRRRARVARRRAHRPACAGSSRPSPSNSASLTGG